MWCKSLEVLNPYEALKEATMPDLKPCPFCGSKNIRLTCWGLYRCWCVDCLSQATDCISKKEAIEAWNRRAGEEDKRENLD